MADPYCLAMVLCDSVHRDPATGKFTLLGTFDSFVAKTYPAQIKLAIYFAVTDGIGSCTLRLQLVDAKLGTIDAKIEGDIEGRIFGVKGEHTFKDPLEVSEEAMELVFSIPTPGVYLCELWANDNMLMQRRFVAHQPEAGEE